MLQPLLNFAMWNIEGLTSVKCTDPHFLSYVSNFDILSFVETWSSDHDVAANLPGFQLVDSRNRQKHKKARRNSGGIKVFVKNAIFKGVEKLSTHSPNPDIIWVKFDQKFFNMDKDIYMAIVYVSPENKNTNTQNLETLYSNLLASIVKYSNLGHIIVQGDFNAYTNTSPDFVCHDDPGHIILDDHYTFDTCLPRNNVDMKRPNNSGKFLLELCKETGLRILNGRKVGDLDGNFTCIRYNGCSVVDYTLVSCDLYNVIGCFEVHNFTPFSDHRLISCSMLTSFLVHQNNNIELYPPIAKYLWNNDAIDNYVKNLSSKDCQQKIHNFLRTEFYDCDLAVKTFNEILYDCANKSTKLIQKQISVKPKKKTPKKPWFSESSRDLHISVKNYAKLVNKFPHIGKYRSSFYKLRSKLRRVSKKEEKAYKEKIHSELSRNIDRDPKHFWKLINKLDNKNKVDDNDLTCNSTFTDFFQKLHQIDENTNEMQNKITKEFESLKNRMELDKNHTLNDAITANEILDAVKHLKNNKSSSIDLISNEMLKNGTNFLLNSLVKLFNLIFKTGKFPTIWNTSLLVLLHKKGDKLDPANYRGISITSNLGKLFNRIIHDRLYNFIYENNLISENQIGFKKNSRTSDHIFTLKSITDHYKQKGKKVFAAFIDLKKAFDTVWRIGLFYKLIDKGIPNRLYNIISSMYTETTYRLKFQHAISQSYKSERGVKQGDVLSPLLFNFYIDDLVQAFNNNATHPVSIGNTSLSILLYADDIVLLSESKSGLQQCLDILSKYCMSWKLHVNTCKSKVLIFNSNGKSHQDEFQFLDTSLETVKQYIYLGITMKFNGNFDIAISTLADKARKALFKIKRVIGLNNPCKLLEKLFDTMVVPILLYGCEAWGIPKTNYQEATHYEKVHLKFIKEILGVHCKVSNDACRAELSRLPLQKIVLQSCIKFLDHIQNQNESLVNKIYQATKTSNPWVKNINVIIQNLGFSFIVDKDMNIKPYVNSIKQRITDQFLQMQNANIQSFNKLIFFSKFFDMNKRPEYVDKLKNRIDRSMICKIRISAHELAIEKGRYTNVPRDNRFCNACNVNLIEDEEHFLLHCTAYTETRNKLLKELEPNIKNLHSMDTNAKLHMLLNNSSIKTLILSSSFILDCLNIRKSLLSNNIES